MKQTAVEWLIEEIERNTGLNYLYEEDYVIKAKEMEKQQIIDACYFAYNEGCSYMSDGKTEYDSFEQYYNETFKKK